MNTIELEQEAGPSESKGPLGDSISPQRSPVLAAKKSTKIPKGKTKPDHKPRNSKKKQHRKKSRPKSPSTETSVSHESSSSTSDSESVSDDSDSSRSSSSGSSSTSSTSASSSYSDKMTRRKPKSKAVKSTNKKSKLKDSKKSKALRRSPSPTEESIDYSDGSSDDEPQKPRARKKHAHDKKPARRSRRLESDVEIIYDKKPINIRRRRSRSRSFSPLRTVRHRRRHDDDYLPPPRNIDYSPSSDCDDLLNHPSFHPPRAYRVANPLPPSYLPPPPRKVTTRDRGLSPSNNPIDLDELLGIPPVKKSKNKKKAKKVKPGSKVAYKRVDQLWDATTHNYKLKATVKEVGQEVFDQYVFVVRRRFDWDNKYVETHVDIKSKPLKECLQHVLAGVKGVSLVQETPNLDPNMLFLYVEEFRNYQQELLKLSKHARKSKDRKSAKTKAEHLKVLVKYVDKDYKDVKKSLSAMLKTKTITFDLAWAFFKPNTIAYTGTYGDQDEPRAFRIGSCVRQNDFLKGTWYSVNGKFLEYDGKAFGMSILFAEILSFAGARKVSTLDCYPLEFHKDADNLRVQLIERGKKFVALQGMNYKFHDGLAYSRRKRQVLKINVTGRIMVDPAMHRRINPNYALGLIIPKDDGDTFKLSDSEGDGGCASSSQDEGSTRLVTPTSSATGQQKGAKKWTIAKDADGRTILVEANAEAQAEVKKQASKLSDSKDEVEASFTEEELLIASPVVLGFAFSEKLWLEFTVSNITEVVYNVDAFDSLVLPENQKSIVKALVSSHAFQPTRNIDDIITGKGKGLVAVLHGPPGTGKTLTAEGIADLLKCPLYMVSAGDLGTDARTLEKELQNILDIAHSWGAILLLDEADVFLERRTVQDIHRNALVSIFLRLLEYFQGILFLTTNRVLAFDEAFISRIHLSLRYEELNTKARKTIWKLFINKVKNSEGLEVAPMSEIDFTDLAKHGVNGRQIKNIVRAAQALAVYETKPLSLAHIKRVIDVAESFEIDLKGGTGYNDAMRSYT